MVPLVSLWLPIVLSAVLVFVVSSVIHMVLKYHKKDFLPVPEEEAARAVLGKQNLSPGQYMIPSCKDMKDAATPEMVKKFTEGPVAIITVLPRGPMNIGKNLTQWFLFSLGISVFVAYVASRSLDAASPYLLVFRISATSAFLGYAGAVVSSGIWHGVPWGIVWKLVFDGLLYALVTAGAFAGFWPR